LKNNKIELSIEGDLAALELAIARMGKKRNK
jgi:hypothetical protein